MTVIDIKAREADKHALDAHYATDALANADALDQIHKRMAQLTEIYKLSMQPLLECADAITDDGHAKEFLAGIQDLCGETFGTLPDSADTIRNATKGGY